MADEFAQQMKAWARRMRDEGERLVAQRAIKRTCAGCSVCCTTHSVRGVTDAGEACRHLCGNKCSIYRTRPVQCVDYACLWRVGILSNELDPKKINASIDFHHDMMPDKRRTWAMTIRPLSDDQDVAPIAHALVRSCPKDVVLYVGVAWPRLGEGAPMLLFRAGSPEFTEAFGEDYSSISSG